MMGRSDPPPAGKPYVENPYTGLLKSVEGGLAVQFYAGAGPPLVTPPPVRSRRELSDAA
jgi:hypothetical protein